MTIKETFYFNNGEFKTLNMLKRNGEDRSNWKRVRVELDEIYQSCEVFYGCWNDAEEGEEYIDEWQSRFEHDDEVYYVYWRFWETKGEERDADDLPFDNHATICGIEKI